MNKQKVVAVVMGGPSDEREISLVTGKAIANALREKDYKIVEIDLEPKMFFEQMRKNKVDIVFNAVHGLYGEDGRLQTLLEILEIPYTGTGMLASAICLDKAASKRILQFEKISTPKALIFNKDDHRRYDKEILEKS